MQETSLRDESLLFQWNFFERAISNYSIIIKMFQHMEGEKDLFAHMPRVFVEETIFDTCELIMRDDGSESFFGLDNGLRSIDCEELEKAKGPVFSPSVFRSVFGYGTLYVYPLKRSIHVFGYLILGKRKSVSLDTHSLRDLELLCEILNRFVLLTIHAKESRMADDAKIRQLDSRLATTKTLLEGIIDQLPHALLMVDRNGTVCFANRCAREEFYEGKGLLAGERIEDVIPGIERGFLEKDLILQGEMHHRKGDEYKLYSLESHPVKDDQGKIVFKSIVLKDVADQRMEEEESAHRNRMETIGKLAGGVAHDFNNVLTGILGYASLMKRMTQEEGQLNRYAEVIESSAKRAATLTEHLLNFARRQRARVVDQIDLNALVGDVLFLIRESFRNVVIEAELDPHLPPIKGEAGELQHAVLNLCINAKDAMPEGGTLKVRTCKRAYIGDEEFVVLTIQDTGCGMDDRVKNKVFEPFFTTKVESKRLGVGLFMVQKTIKSCGGFIELESSEGKGTLFTLYFPLSSARKEEPAKIVTPIRDPRKRNILVVDDEEVVRELLSGVLLSEGFRVLTAKDGAEAIAIFQENAGSIDLVILDMIMPGMKGEEVLRWLRKIPSSPRVVISSGFMSEEQRDKLQEYGVDGFLDKPYGDIDALNIIRAVLGAAKTEIPR